MPETGWRLFDRKKSHRTSEEARVTIYDSVGAGKEVAAYFRFSSKAVQMFAKACGGEVPQRVHILYNEDDLAVGFVAAAPDDETAFSFSQVGAHGSMTRAVSARGFITKYRPMVNVSYEPRIEGEVLAIGPLEFD